MKLIRKRTKDRGSVALYTSLVLGVILLVGVGTIGLRIYTSRLVTHSTACFTAKVPANYTIVVPDGGARCNFDATYNLTTTGEAANTVVLVIAPATEQIDPNSSDLLKQKNPKALITQTTLGGLPAYSVETKIASRGAYQKYVRTYLVNVPVPYNRAGLSPAKQFFVEVVAPIDQKDQAAMLVGGITWK